MNCFKSLIRPTTTSSSRTLPSTNTNIGYGKIKGTIQWIQNVLMSSHHVTIPDVIQALFARRQPDVPGVPSHVLSEIRRSLTLDSDRQDFYSSSIFILAYLTILNGHKDIYFNADGSLNSEKLQKHIKDLFELNIRIDESNNHLLQGIRKSSGKGDIQFGSFFKMNHAELESAKPYRGIRYVAEAMPQFRGNLYPNWDGICTGLVHSHEETLKARCSNPELSREQKEIFLEKLRRAELVIEDDEDDEVLERKEILGKEFELQEKYRFQNHLYEEKLGHVSHVYLTCGLSDFIGKLPEHVADMIKNGEKSSTLTVVATDHVMNLTLSLSQGILKVTLYDPNTKGLPDWEGEPNKDAGGPLVSYTHDVDLTQGTGLAMIREVFQKTRFFSEEGGYDPKRDPALEVFCYPLEKTLPNHSEFKFIYPDISKISDPAVLSSLLFLASKNGHTEIVAELLKKEGIDVNHKLENYGCATPLIIAAHNGHTHIVRGLLAKEGIEVNHEMTSDGGATALFAAAKTGREDVVELLLQHETIQLNQKFDVGLPYLVTTADIAEMGGHTEIAALIKADPRSPEGGVLARRGAVSDFSAFDADLSDDEKP